MLIALGHWARVGKDTIGDFLAEDHGFTRMAFADALRDLAMRIDPMIAMQVHHDIRLSDAVRTVGYEDAKDTWPEVRRFLQNLGVGCREAFDPEIWVRQVERRLRDLDPAVHDIVITDLRFPNEAKMVRLWRGHTVKVTRPGFGGMDAHESERALNEWRFNAILENDGTLEDLRRKASELVEWARGQVAA